MYTCILALREDYENFPYTFQRALSSIYKKDNRYVSPNTMFPRWGFYQKDWEEFCQSDIQIDLSSGEKK